jgi:predicted naringenin-chalcone synthase
MPVRLHRFATALPPTRYTQEEAGALMEAHVEGRPAVRRMIRSLYRNSGIEGRNSVVDDFGTGQADPLFFDGEGARLPPPGTGARNRVYAREARTLFAEVAHGLVGGQGSFAAHEVTHVITLSCTGFYAPGPDYDVVRALSLPGSTVRVHIGFMGCYAAFQGLRVAEAFCRADPEAVVLVLAVELCTLHLQFTSDTDDLIAGAVFADGGAGVVVSARAPRGRGPVLELESLRGDLATEGEADMAWTIGDEGFRMRLSTYVPELVGGAVGPLVRGVLGPRGLEAGEIRWWGVHPGGRAILDRVEEVMELPPEALAASREVLRRHGNMSSATVLFVLDALLRGPVAEGERVLAMAFGPGLTLESGLFRVRRPGDGGGAAP